jgi:pantoate--beta-alanine ligase
MIKVISSVPEMVRFCRRVKERGQKIALVPTLGTLHEGHLSLVAAAKAKADILVVSIFVNPIQFSPQEDLKKYPRNLRRDQLLLKPFAPLTLFHPSPADLYPQDFDTYVEEKDLSPRLCGQFRPGHFRGVTTVVAKLFNIIQPDYAFFGEKDFQQQLIIKKMVRDLNYPLEIVILPTVREYDGLALSSRNSYLKPGERKSATILYRALNRGKEDLERGETDAHKILLNMKRLIAFEPAVRLEYLVMVDPVTLEPLKRVRGRVLLALAARVGSTRLIDNLIVCPK